MLRNARKDPPLGPLFTLNGINGQIGAYPLTKKSLLQFL